MKRMTEHSSASFWSADTKQIRCEYIFLTLLSIQAAH